MTASTPPQTPVSPVRIPGTTLVAVIVLWAMAGYGFAGGIYTTGTRLGVVSAEIEVDSVELPPGFEAVTYLGAAMAFVLVLPRIVFAFWTGMGSRWARVGAMVTETVSAAFWLATLLVVERAELTSTVAEYTGIASGNLAVIIGACCSVGAVALLATPGSKAWNR
ncbi:hypothetical protein [Glycomyces rhizosphaerae]|uniref:DUF2975 domain-containing protein n=1 Tax=Glycomyces rhizosphaerae TaxID=2054422 RepID=A0ABV7PRC2_9ACTN